MKNNMKSEIVTRRFKALTGKGENAKLVEKIAVYDQSGEQIDCCIIQKDDDGREYYYPNNPNDEDGIFLNRPKDAIECIRNGYGDVMKVCHIFGLKMEHVVRYIDRNYGEELRQKTLEGWKDAKFAYGVKFEVLNSFSGGSLVKGEDELMGFGDRHKDARKFENEADAEEYIKKVEEKVKEYDREYTELEEKEMDEDDKTLAFHHFFEKMRGNRATGLNSLYWNVFRAFREEKKSGRKEYGLEVVQVVA